MIINEKAVEIFESYSKSDLLVVLNSFEKCGRTVKDICIKNGCPDFSLVEISKIDWNRDLSPWKSDPVFKEEKPFTGKADEHLKTITDEIIPYAQSSLGYCPGKIAVAGYSLAGLFALYSLVRCNIFSAAASCSGSLWYPGFTEYIEENIEEINCRAVYLSLGDKEAKTRNTVMADVENKTEYIYNLFRKKGINTEFEINPGNHFRDNELRIAKGISWMLSNV